VASSLGPVFIMQNTEYRARFGRSSRSDKEPLGSFGCLGGLFGVSGA